MFDLWWGLKLDTSMSFLATELKQRCLILLFIGITSIPAFPQAADSPIKFIAPGAVTATFVDAPSLGGSNNSSGSSRDSKWLKIEFRYSVTPTKGDYVDSVEFKVWVEGRDLANTNAPGDEGAAVALTGSVTYVNIPTSKEAYGVFYVHPSTLTRYGGKGGSSDFERKFDVHVAALVGGSIVDNVDKNKEKDPAWFQPLIPIAGFVCRQDQSPFLLADLNRYPAIKLPATQ